MTRNRYTTEQIIHKLREADVEMAAGASVPMVCRKLAISERTYYRWRKRYGGLRSNQAKRLKELEQDNSRLKRLVGELNLDKSILRGGDAGNLLSPAKKRRAVKQVRKQMSVSERRACRVLDQPRSTQRRQPGRSREEQRLVNEMVELASEYGRYGYRRITALLRQRGWRVNHKRVERLWRREGLKVPQNKIAEEKAALAQRRFVRSASAGTQESRLELRLRPDSNGGRTGGASADPDGRILTGTSDDPSGA